MAVAAAAIVVGALAAAALVAAAPRRSRRGPKRDAAVARGLRRGAIAGSLVLLAGLLRAGDGLTPLTAAFVAAPFIVAEVVLSTRRA